jgi:transcriptional regulator with XRE-family HTH domain
MALAARVNSVSLEGSIDAPENGSEDQAELTRLLFLAAAGCGLQEKELAVALGYDPAYLSRIKSGEKPLPAARLEQLPKVIRRALWVLAAEADGLVVAPEDARRQAIGNLLVAIGEVVRLLDDRASGSKRMARASI